MDAHTSDEERFKDDVSSNRPYLVRFATSLCHDQTRAEDLANTTIAKAIAARLSFDPNSNLIAWLVTITKNTYFSERRKKSNQTVGDEDDAIAKRTLSTMPSPDSNLNVEAIFTAIEKLAPEHREVIHLAKNGLSTEEMAKRLGVPEGTVKSRLNRGRIALAALLPEEDLDVLDSKWPVQATKIRKPILDSLVRDKALPPMIVSAPLEVTIAPIQERKRPKVDVLAPEQSALNPSSLIKIKPEAIMPTRPKRTAVPKSNALDSFTFFTNEVPELLEGLKANGYRTIADIIGALSEHYQQQSPKTIRLYVLKFANGGMLQQTRSPHLPFQLPSIIASLAGLTDLEKTYAHVLSKLKEPIKAKWEAALNTKTESIKLKTTDAEHSEITDSGNADPESVGLNSTDSIAIPLLSAAVLLDAPRSTEIDPQTTSDDLSVSKLQSNIFALQRVLADLGIQSTTDRSITSTFTLAAQSLTQLDPETLRWWEKVLKEAAASLEPSIVEPLSIDPAIILIPESAARVESTTKKEPLLRSPPTVTSIEEDIAEPVSPTELFLPVSEATTQHMNKRAKTLASYPLFANPINDVVKLALLKAGISMRTQLIRELTLRGFNPDSLQPTLNTLLKQTQMTNKFGRLSPAAKCIVEEIALLGRDEVARFLNATAAQKSASKTAPNPLHASVPESAINKQATPHIPAEERPVEALETTPIPINEQGTEGRSTSDLHHVLLQNLIAAFPLVAQHMTKLRIVSMDDLWRSVPESYRGSLPDFVTALETLVATRQPYKRNDGRLIPVASLLSIALTPKLSLKELWGDCEDAVVSVQRHRRLGADFGELMKKYSSNLISNRHRKQMGSTVVDSTLNTVSELQLGLQAALNHLPKAERPARIAAYVKLFKGTDQPFVNKTLTQPAAEIMDLFQIPSAEVISVLPKLADELLYSDMVRNELPFLAQLMRQAKIYTVSAVTRVSTKIISPDMQNALLKKLQAPHSSLLKEGGANDPIVILLADVFHTSPQDILSTKGFLPVEASPLKPKQRIRTATA